MTKFNFETRELCPYREYWNNNIKKLFGALWYIKEKDGIYLLDTSTTRPRNNTSSRHYDETLIAKGLPAALLAQDNLSRFYPTEFGACHKAYFKVAQNLFPKKQVYQISTILDDWECTLSQLSLIDPCASVHLDNFSRITVAAYIRGISNPYQEEKLENIIKNAYQLTCLYPNQDVAQLIRTQMPDVEDRTEAPLVFSNRLDEPPKAARLQVSGFMAAIVNLAVFYYWKQRWPKLNFADIELVKRINQACKKLSPVVEIADIHNVSFNLPIEVKEICIAYMNAFEPVMGKVWKMKPEVQLECIEGDNFYTYIYAHEASSLKQLLESELYANLTNEQKRTLVSYGRRFMEWLVKTYHITTASQHRVMQAMAKDMPPIQLEITNNTQITHKSNPIPKENNYSDVIRWLEQEKIDGHDHFEEAGRNRTKMCKKLSEIFGWYVEQNSLQKAQNRKQKK